MNLIQAILHAAHKALPFGDANSHAALVLVQQLTAEQQAMLNDFFEVLLHSKLTDLINGCGGDFPKPLTRTISICWAIEDVLEVRQDLTEEQAAEVLEEVARIHDASLGINWDVLQEVANTLFPEPEDLG